MGGSREHLQREREGGTNRQTNRDSDREQEREGGRGVGLPQVRVREPILAQSALSLSLFLGGQGHSFRFFPPSLPPSLK